ncbi:MAG: FAD binding domain-containing protein, partial [Chloroflexota bacterium]
MLRLPRFTYVAPATLDEAIRLRSEHVATSMYVAGGTDVYPKMKRRQFQPELVVSLGNVVRADVTNGSAHGLRIGAGATLTAVSEHPKVRAGYRALAEAAALVSTPQLRNMGTLGGNICLDTRCNWYDQSLFWRTAEGFCMKT